MQVKCLHCRALSHTQGHKHTCDNLQYTSMYSHTHTQNKTHRDRHMHARSMPTHTHRDQHTFHHSLPTHSANAPILWACVARFSSTTIFLQDQETNNITYKFNYSFMRINGQVCNLRHTGCFPWFYYRGVMVSDRDRAFSTASPSSRRHFHLSLRFKMRRQTAPSPSLSLFISLSLLLFFHSLFLPHY